VSDVICVLLCEEWTMQEAVMVGVDIYVYEDIDMCCAKDVRVQGGARCEQEE
jgi:hypothetical protein